MMADVYNRASQPSGSPSEQLPARRSPATDTVDLALQILEHLAHRSQSAPLGAITKEFWVSKATIYRHLQALVQQGFVHQDEATGNYEVGIKLVVLGEAGRGRFDIVRGGRRALEQRGAVSRGADSAAREDATGGHRLRHGAGLARRAGSHPGPYR